MGDAPAPEQGDQDPWPKTQSYGRDNKLLLEDPVDDGVMQFTEARVVDHVAAVEAS